MGGACQGWHKGSWTEMGFGSGEGVPGSLDPASPVRSLDQLFVQASCLEPLLLDKVKVRRRPPRRKSLAGRSSSVHGAPVVITCIPVAAGRAAGVCHVSGHYSAIAV